MAYFSKLKYLAVLPLLIFILCPVAVHAAEIGSDPPANPPFTGGYFISGTSSLGAVTVYTPVSDGWCLDDNGYLFRFASNSATGKIYTSNGSVYDFRCPSFSASQYRATDSSYTYSDLRLVPVNSNISIQQDFAPILDRDYMLALLQVGLIGLVFISILTKRR